MERDARGTAPGTGGSSGGSGAGRPPSGSFRPAPRPPGAKAPSDRPILTHLRPPLQRASHLLPLAVIVSGCLHIAGLVLFVMHPVARQRPLFREPMLVKLIELPKGTGGATQGTPGRTPEQAPPKTEEPPKPKAPPKTTLPGKVPPAPKEGPSPLETTRPGQAVGLGHGGAAGLGGSGTGVILDEPTFQYEWYKARLEDLLRSHWKKPVMGDGKNVSASVHFTITPTGDALDVQIVSSSGNTQFDQSVLRAVYSSAPFPKFPPQYDAAKLGVLYTFELLPQGSSTQLSAPPPKRAGKRP